MSELFRVNLLIKLSTTLSMASLNDNLFTTFVANAHSQQFECYLQTQSPLHDC
jgi:hypothetical protein